MLFFTLNDKSLKVDLRCLRDLCGGLFHRTRSMWSFSSKFSLLNTEGSLSGCVIPEAASCHRSYGAYQVMVAVMVLIVTSGRQTDIRLVHDDDIR